MLWRRSLFAVFLLASMVPCAHAQRDIEVTPFFGARFGGKIDVDTENVDYLTIRSTYNFGVMGGATVWGDSLEPEFMWNRQPTEINAHSLFNGSITPITPSNIDMYQFDLSYNFRARDARFRPFIVGGLGFTHFGNTQSILGFGNRFSYNLGGGVKHFFTDHVGVRLEARWSPSHTTSSLAEECNPFFGYCGTAQVANKAEQGQVNVGLIYRFQK